jgi:hypothetical protein
VNLLVERRLSCSPKAAVETQISKIPPLRGVHNRLRFGAALIA